MTTRTSRPVLALGLFLVLTGCSGPAGGDGVASAGGTTTSTAQLSDHDRAVQFAQCLREHGIEVEDPEGDRPPAIPPQGADSEQKVEAAEEACRQYLPTQLRERTLDAEQVEKLRQVAQCMREHGFPNFPDPDPEQGGISLGDDSGIDTKDPKFQAAQQECGMGRPGANGEQMNPEGN